MGDTWYLIIWTPAPSVDVWPVGEDPLPDDEAGVALRDSRISAAKALLSVPYEWPELPGWAVSYGPGLPHQSVLAVATLHDGPPE